mgnify:FL=1
MKPWRCKECGAHLGRVTRNGSGVHQLLLYREAIDTRKEEVADLDVIAVVEGYAADVRCSNCNYARTWVPGKEAIRRLLENSGINDERISEVLDL